MTRRRRSWTGTMLATAAGAAFVLLSLWAASLVHRSLQVQATFDRAGTQAVQITGLQEGLTRLHQAGSAVLQSYAVGYQRLVFEKTYDQYLGKRLAPGIPWDPSCGDCLRALDGAVKAHQAQALRVFDSGTRWEARPPGPAKERARRRVADDLYALERVQGQVLTAFQNLEAANRDLMAKALRDHQRHAYHLYAFAATTLLLALGLLAAGTLAWMQARRTRFAERMVWEAQKMEAVGALAAGVVHDVRNLLAPVGLAEEILADMPGRTPAEQRLLEQIHRSTEAANTLLAQLLRIARKEAPGPAGPVDVHACLEESLALLRLSLGKGIQVETRLAPGAAFAVGRRGELVQVFSNLFINAAHAMHGEGRLMVESSFLGPALEVRVHDTGEGMSPQVQARIFDPRFTTKGEKGTGLGLFTVKRILEAMGAGVRVESEGGRGSTFILRIPSRPAEVVPGAAVDGSVPGWTKPNPAAP